MIHLLAARVIVSFFVLVHYYQVDRGTGNGIGATCGMLLSGESAPILGLALEMVVSISHRHWV